MRLDLSFFRRREFIVNPIPVKEKEMRYVLDWINGWAFYRRVVRGDRDDRPVDVKHGR
jgi:hypothetical protein